MNDNTKDQKSPEMAIENSKTVAETLRMLNDVIDQQRQSIITMTTELTRTTINLVKEVNSKILFVISRLQAKQAHTMFIFKCLAEC